MKPGETLVVLGASGGVGLAAVEIGALMGARVIACASSDDKLAFARGRGAAEGINYAVSDLRAELKRLAPGGIDVVYDPVGGAQTEIALRSMAWKGRLLVIGFASGEIPRPPLNLTLLRGCDIRGVYWGDFVKREPELHQENMARLLIWAAEEKLSAHVHAVHELEDFLPAFQSIARREAIGKVLLRLNAG
jgi:NADPH2:quinone reductase